MNFETIDPLLLKKREFFKSDTWFHMISSILSYSKSSKTKVYLAYQKKIPYRLLYLVKNLHQLIPHCAFISRLNKKKWDLKREIKSEKSFLFWFEALTKKNCFGMKIFCFPRGFNLSFLVTDFENFLNSNFLGNAFQWTRPILTFDQNFKQKSHLRILKLIFSKIFALKKQKKFSQPFFDHLLVFSETNSEICFRVYQIKSNYPNLGLKKKDPLQLIEIGPRITFFLRRIWSDSIKNKTIFDSNFA